MTSGFRSLSREHRSISLRQEGSLWGPDSALARSHADLKILLRFLLLIACICSLSGEAPARDFYVSPQGSPHGNGKAKKPWSLQAALSHPAVVQPGDTIWL